MHRRHDDAVFELHAVDLDRSVKFYEDVFGMKEVFRMHPKSAPDMVLCFLSDRHGGAMITLVWYGERKTPYELGGEQRAHRARDGRF